MRAMVCALLLVACSKPDANADANAHANTDANANANASANANANASAHAGSPLPPGEMELVVGPPTEDAGRTKYTLRSDGTFVTPQRTKSLPKVTTASVLALADEVVEACAEAGAGARAALIVTHGDRTKAVSHDVTNDGCTRALSRLERRLVGLR